MRIYVPILITPDTNEVWLDILLKQLQQAPEGLFCIRLLSGSESTETLPARRYELVMGIPDDCTHIFCFMDPDDLLYMGNFLSALRRFVDPGVRWLVLLRETFGDLPGKVSFGSKAIIRKAEAQKMASIGLNRPERREIYFIGQVTKMSRGAYSEQPAYRWRIHDDQLTQKGKQT